MWIGEVKKGKEDQRKSREGAVEQKWRISAGGGSMTKMADKCSECGRWIGWLKIWEMNRVAGRSGRCIGEVRKGGQKRAEFPRGASQPDE